MAIVFLAIACNTKNNTNDKNTFVSIGDTIIIPSNSPLKAKIKTANESPKKKYFSMVVGCILN